MIIIKLWGGLGNQLFQYAFGYAMAKENNDTLALDVDFYKKQYSYVGYRTFDLDKLMCPIQIAERNNVCVRLLECFLVNRILQRIKSVFVFKFGKLYFVKEKKKTYMHNVPYKKNAINYYDGYWQSSLYFNKYKEQLSEIFRPSINLTQEVEKFLGLIDSCPESVSVHVRKGDFSQKKRVGHPVELQYYNKAISYIQDKLVSPVFFVFSDDIEWVKHNIDFGSEVHFASYRCAEGAIMDMFCMSKCKHGIMSASTFSWWGCWLKEEKNDTIVIAPSGTYYNDKFIEEKWIRV